MWCLTDLAALLDIRADVLYKRIDAGWPPERWGEPLRQSNSRKPNPAVNSLTPRERENLKAYTDDELLELYQAFKGAPDELTRLADFMASDVEAARTKIIRWKVEGKI